MRAKSDNAEKIVYDYFSEDTEICGTFELSKTDGNINVIKIAPTDEQSQYLHHAVSKALEFYNANQFKNNVTVAWY